MLFQSTGNCWITAAFYLNRNRIATELCINRFDLIPVCKGACFLERKLSENENRQERSPEIKFKEITLFCQHPTGTPVKHISTDNLIPFCGYRSPYFPSLHTRQVFRPPVLSA